MLVFRRRLQHKLNLLECVYNQVRPSNKLIFPPIWLESSLSFLLLKMPAVKRILKKLETNHPDGLSGTELFLASEDLLPVTEDKKTWDYLNFVSGPSSFCDSAKGSTLTYPRSRSGSQTVSTSTRSPSLRP
jgi:hypothetical protein